MAQRRSAELNDADFARILLALTDLLAHRRKGQDKSRKSILVALSGGPDSVALLHLIHATGSEQGFAVTAAHVNYRLRGEESEEDERFCRSLCKQLGVRLHVRRANLSAGKPGTNLQAEARRIRYKFFDAICAKHGIDWIATGHNLTDSVETILMNLCRGAGTFGLSGIEPVSGKIIRPLLDFTREQIIEYLRRRHIPYRTDRSNLESKYTRNKVRQRLLPAVVSVFGDRAVGNIARSGRILAQQEAYLRLEIARLMAHDAIVTPFGKIALDLRRFRRYDGFLKQLLIAECFRRLTGSLRDFDSAAAQRVIEQDHAVAVKTDLTRGVTAEIAGSRLYVYAKTRGRPAYAVGRPGCTDLSAYAIELSVEEVRATGLTANDLRLGKNLRVYVDADKMRGRLSVRSARAGDHFSPLGMKGSKKLSDFFIDRRIDRPLREENPLLLCGDKVVWIIGYEIADDVKISSQTKKALKLEVKRHRDH